MCSVLKSANLSMHGRINGIVPSSNMLARLDVCYRRSHRPPVVRSAMIFEFNLDGENMSPYVGRTTQRHLQLTRKEPLSSERLLLREWCEEDLQAFAELNSDDTLHRFVGPNCNARSDCPSQAPNLRQDRSVLNCEHDTKL